MEVKELVGKDPVVADKQLFWYVVIHLVFVGSSVLLALSDRIAGHNLPDNHHGTPLPAAKEAAGSSQSVAHSAPHETK